MKSKEVLEKSYQNLLPFSKERDGDFRRFLFSLDLLSSLDLIKGKKILDVGSGIGIMVSALKNLGAKAVGVDKFIFPNEKENYYSISEFDKLNGIWNEAGVEIKKADILNEPLPFKDNSFDVVVCDATIEHLPESPKRLFEEIYRVLKDNGYFLVTTPNLANLLRRLRFLLGRSPHWDLRDFYESSSNYKGHTREYTLNEVAKMLELASFEVVFKKTRNSFFNPKRFLSRKKAIGQFCALLSWPFPKARQMIFVLAKKK